MRPVRIVVTIFLAVGIVTTLIGMWAYTQLNGFYLARNLDFQGFTHAPVDFEVLLDEDLIGDTVGHVLPITPFYFYSHVNHVEGPRKNYLSSLNTPPYPKVYLPADAVLSRAGMKGLGNTEVLDEDLVHIDTDITFYVSDSVYVRFQHVAFRDDILQQLKDAGGRNVILEAGTHIGYMYFDPWHSVDFMVRDKNSDSGMTKNRNHHWNIMVNPLDYFTEELREEILTLYEPWYEAMKEEGIHDYSDLTDSRTNVNVQGTLEGVWFHDAMRIPILNFSHSWAKINFISKENLHTETYWRVLEHPWNIEHNLVGIFTEQSAEKVPRHVLYDGAPLEISHVYLIDGDLSQGVIEITTLETWDSVGPDGSESDLSDGTRQYLRFEVIESDSIYDEKLRIQGFLTEEESLSGFTGDAVMFRRHPSKGIIRLIEDTFQLAW